jgi:ribonuclease R
VHRILRDVVRESPERWEGEVPIGVFPLPSSASTKSSHKDPGATPWSKRRDHASQVETHAEVREPIPLQELHDIADESSRAERRAAEAERELMEWKKAKFMERHVGEDFEGLIISVTKFGFFVELTDLFVEGLVPLNSLTDDHYTYHENTREIIGQRSHKIYSMGQRIRVLVVRIDPVEKKVEFALLDSSPAKSEYGQNSKPKSRKIKKTEKKKKKKDRKLY